MGFFYRILRFEVFFLRLRSSMACITFESCSVGVQSMRSGVSRESCVASWRFIDTFGECVRYV